MKNDLNLFLISTPLQLINVIEAKRELNISDNTSIAVFLTYASNLITLKKIIDPAQWKEIHFIDEDLESLKKHEANFQKRKIFPVIKKALRNLAKVKILISKFKDVDSLFVGYYLGLENLHMINSIRYNKLYLLDDGIATIEVNERRKRNISFLQNQTLEFKLKIWFKKYVLGYRIEHPRSVIFFTIYDIEIGPNDSIVRHNYSEIKKLIKELEKTNELFFLGQPLSEIHPEIISEGEYFDSLKKIQEHFKANELIYFPHRDESPQKVEKIRSNLSITIRKIDLPFELFLLAQITKPAVISGFITSALPTCKEIFGDEIDIVAIKIDIQKITSRSTMAAVEDTYRYFEKISGNRFKVIALQ